MPFGWFDRKEGEGDIFDCGSLAEALEMNKGIGYPVT